MTGLEERDAAAGAVAVKPRVTLDQVISLIDREETHVFDHVLTIVVLTLKNGYKVVGQSAAASPENFNEQLGHKIAREDAISKIWPLAGFLLRDTLHKAENPPVMRCKVVLSGRMVNVAFATGPDGQPLGRQIVEGEGDRAYKRPDPMDPANWRPDGEKLTFHAVCAGFTSDGEHNVAENRIFGKYSPTFDLNAVVKNDHVLAQLQQGKSYYVDFIPAD